MSASETETEGVWVQRGATTLKEYVAITNPDPQSGAGVIADALTGLEEPRAAGIQMPTSAMRHQCQKCSDWFAEEMGFFTGTSAVKAREAAARLNLKVDYTKVPFICTKCNKLAGRLRTLKNSFSPALVDGFASLDADQLADFFSTNQELQGQALLDAVTAVVTGIRKRTSDVGTGGEGAFMPLGYYRFMRYPQHSIASYSHPQPVIWNPQMVHDTNVGRACTSQRRSSKTSRRMLTRSGTTTSRPHSTSGRCKRIGTKRMSPTSCAVSSSPGRKLGVAQMKLVAMTSRHRMFRHPGSPPKRLNDRQRHRS